MAYRSALSANSRNVSHLQAALVYKVICLDGSTASTVLSLIAWFFKAPFKKGLQWPRLDGQVSSPHQVCPSNGSWDTVWGLSHSVVSISLQPYWLQPTRLHWPWDSQARILEWVAMPSSRGSFQPRNWTCVSYVSCISRQILYHWATREALSWNTGCLPF